MSSTRPALIKSLLRPDVYPHAVARVTLRETHISWVLLTGEFAYKVKKPVKTPFLDFSTLELRHAACREELRINRRFAAEIYLDVLPIAGNPESPRIAGDGNPFEFVLRMRQFPEAAVLSSMAAAKALTTQHIDELARVLAAFHARAEPAVGTDSWGSPDTILREARENIEAMLNAGPEIPSSAIEQLAKWTNDAGQSLRPEFLRRRGGGFVRECHGDLHLGNIVIWNKENPTAAPAVGCITPFDGIEFNPEYRWIDVVSDVAFTAMDLADRGYRELAHRLISAWLEQTGDYEGVAVLDWYLVYRALVRAKVAVIRSRQQTMNQDRAACVQEAFVYVRLAQRFLVPQPRKLVITFGLSGSGKTTHSQRLVDTLGMIRIRSDVERKRLAGLAADADSGSTMNSGLYDPLRTSLTYAHLASMARRMLEAGRSVIVDATFLMREQRRQFQELAHDVGAEFAIVPFEAEEHELRRRIIERGRAGSDASEANLRVLQSQLQRVEPLTAEELTCCRSVEALVGDPPLIG